MPRACNLHQETEMRQPGGQHPGGRMGKQVHERLLRASQHPVSALCLSHLVVTSAWTGPASGIVLGS